MISCFSKNEFPQQELERMGWSGCMQMFALIHTWDANMLLAARNGLKRIIEEKKNQEESRDESEPEIVGAGMEQGSVVKRGMCSVNTKISRC
jgi:hypothetical protein